MDSFVKICGQNLTQTATELIRWWMNLHIEEQSIKNKYQDLMTQRGDIEI